jgi:hypothetical protein
LGRTPAGCHVWATATPHSFCLRVFLYDMAHGALVPSETVVIAPDTRLHVSQVLEYRNVCRRLRVEAAFYSARRAVLPVTVTVTATASKLQALQVGCAPPVVCLRCPATS